MEISLTSKEQKRQIQVLLDAHYGVSITALTRNKLSVEQLRRIVAILAETEKG